MTFSYNFTLFNIHFKHVIFISKTPFFMSWINFSKRLDYKEPSPRASMYILYILQIVIIEKVTTPSPVDLIAFRLKMVIYLSGINWFPFQFSYVINIIKN